MNITVNGEITEQVTHYFNILAYVTHTDNKKNRSHLTETNSLWAFSWNLLTLKYPQRRKHYQYRTHSNKTIQTKRLTLNDS